jgi:hypothetical protein
VETPACRQAASTLRESGGHLGYDIKFLFFWFLAAISFAKKWSEFELVKLDNV